MLRRLASTSGCLVVLVGLTAGCGGDEQQRPPPLVLERPSGDSASPEVRDEPPPTFPNTATTNTIRVAGRNSIENAAGVASAVFPAVDDSTRPRTVALVDADNWQSGVAAAVLASGKLGAPILLTDGDTLPAVTAGTLERLDPAGAPLADGAEVIAVGDGTAQPEDRAVEVLRGDDPYELAAEIDRFHAAVEGEASDDVVIASGEDPEFAMPAAAWAARSGDSVLFTKRGSVPGATLQALEDHDQPAVYVLGPESVISDQVVDDLGEVAGSVRRIDGETPVDTAIEFARYAQGDFGWGLVTPGHNFALAPTSRPLDAAAAAPLAANGTYAPLLLTDEATDLPGALRGYFLDVQPGFEENPNAGVYNRVWILGDEEAVALNVQARIDQLTELIPVDVGGGDGSDPGSGGDRAPDDGGLPPPPPPPGGGGAPQIPGDPGGIPPPQGPGLPGGDV